MKKFNFKNFFQRTDTSGLSVFGRGHNFDWEFLLTTFFISLIGVLLFSLQVFLGVRSGDMFQAQSKPAVSSMLINRNGLSQVIKNFAVKADNLKKLQTNRPTLVDPSR